MGTKVQCESYFPGHFQMRDVSDDANSSSWPQYYGDNKTFTNGQFYNNGNFLPRTIAERYPGYDKDLVKRTMLEQEATFRHQLYELHRLYRIQRDLMDEVKRKELYKIRMREVEASVPSSPSASHVTSEDARRRHIPGFPLGNSVCTRPSTSAIDNNTNSPLSSVMGSSTYTTSPLPFQNGTTSKEVEILESRPTKVRRKMFDLRLPADEYIITEEGRPLKGVHNLPGNLQHRNLNNTMKANCRDDVSLAESCPRGIRTSVADLNEPIVIEETNPSEHPFHGKIRGSELDRRQMSWKSNHGSDHKGPLPHRDFQANGNGNHQWLMKPTCEESLPSSSRSMQALFNRALEPPPPNFPIVDHKRNHHLRDSIESFNSCHREAVIASSVSNPYPFAPDPSKSWSHSAHSVVHHPHLNSSATWSKSPQSSTTQSNGKLADRWNSNTTSTSNQKFGSEMANRNGYQHNGISTGLNELQFSVPPRSYGQLNQINHGSRYMDLKPLKGVNLNVAISNGSTNKAGTQHGIEVIDLERKDDISNLSSLPWLRAEIDLNAGKSSFLGSSNHPVWHGNKKSASQSTNPESSRNKEIDDSTGCNGKILGFPIFRSAHLLPKKEASFEVKEVENKVTHILFDMNMPCEDNDDVVELVKTERATKVSNFRCEIDLNSCVSEDEAPDFKKKPFTGIDLEAPVVPEAEEDAGIDLLANVHEEEPSLLRHREAERPLDELAKVAAEAIIAISSSASCSIAEVSVTNPLQWFADVISSCGDYLESIVGNATSSSSHEVFDYFEWMTLKLTETREEDYMPKPLVPEGLINLDEMGATTSVVLPTTRGRRGNARRGRQRRDFQRDILPGLVSLSRHEVTEDIQTFVGLMRATGHLTWQSGLARRGSTRNGCGRGRRRSVVSSPPPPLVDLSPPPPPLIQQLKTIEVGMEDRSIRGWGKTTRRPRRQRCPPGNLPSLPVT